MRTVFQAVLAQTTRRAWVMLALFASVLLLALATGEDALYRLSYFLALVVVISYGWAQINLRRLDMRTEQQDSVAQVGETLEGSIYVRNGSWLPVSWVEIVQLSDMPGRGCGGAAQLSPHSWEAWRTDRLCHSRGVYTVGPLVARTNDPLGLFKIERTQGDPMKIVVYPPVLELPYFRLPVGGLAGEERVARRARIRSAHASAVREYSHNDSLSLIHWPYTAKCDRLMCKEFDAGGYGDLWIVVDLERRVQQSKGWEKTDEYAVAAAASIAHRALTEERPVGLIAYGDQEYLLPLGSGSRQMSRVLETLATSKTEGDAALGFVLGQNAARFLSSASVLVVTSSIDTEWVDVLQSLADSGLRATVALVDPESFGGDRSCVDVVMKLAVAGIETYIIRSGDLLSSALSRSVAPHDLAILERWSLGELAPASEA